MKKKTSDLLLLHVGCGDRYIEGFIHIDIRPLPHVDYVASANKLDMFSDNSVDLIYACHVLEHFGRHDIQKVLKEWHRVLKPGGILRVCVPDFDATVEVYQLYKNLELITGLLYGRQDYLGNTHSVVFNYESLFHQLVEAGFKNIGKYNWRDTDHSVIDDYSQAYIPHMDKNNGILVSLNVEGKK